MVGLDPECAFAVLTGGGAVLGRGPFVLFNFGAGFIGLTPDDGPHTIPATNYIYTYRVSGQGAAVTVKVSDQPGQYSDNYGYVQITIQSVSGQSSGGGGAGSLIPPGGSTQSVLRTISGIPTWGAQPDITEADLSLSDNTTANASTTKHGLLRKLDNNAAHFLDGTGAWTAPSGGGTISQITSTGSSIALTAPTGPTTNVDVAASGVTAASYGDSSHVASITVGADGRITSASSVGIAGGSGTIGFEVGYDQITAGVNITGTTEAAPTTIITCAAHTFDGAPVLATFFSPNIVMPTGSSSDVLGISLWEGATELGAIAFLRSGVTANTAIFGGSFMYRFTPSAASHTYLVRAWVSSTTGTPGIGAGAAGVGARVPAFVRFTKV